MTLADIQLIDIQRVTDTHPADTLLIHILIDILWIDIQQTDIRFEAAGDTHQDRGTLAAILIDSIRTAIPALMIGDAIHSVGTLWVSIETPYLWVGPVIPIFMTNILR